MEATDDDRRVEERSCVIPFKSAFTFSNLTRDHDVRFYTGIDNAESFLAFYTHLQRKATQMHYWKGDKTGLASPRSTKKVSLRSLAIE